MKEIMKQSIIGIIVIIVVAIITWYWGLFSLPAKVDSLTKRNDTLQTEVKNLNIETSELKQKYSYLIGYLSGKFNINLANFFDISSQKNLTQHQINTGIYLLMKNPMKASSYLKQELGFTSEEIEQSITPPIHSKVFYKNRSIKAQ